jgi:hypothetical protein
MPVRVAGVVAQDRCRCVNAGLTLAERWGAHAARSAAALPAASRRWRPRCRAGS